MSLFATFEAIQQYNVRGGNGKESVGSDRVRERERDRERERERERESWLVGWLVS